MKNKLILIVTVLSILTILQGCGKQNDNTQAEEKPELTSTILKGEDTSGNEYEYEVKNKCKELANANSSSFAITDNTNFFITVTGEKNEMKKNKDKVVEYLKGDTKYQTVTLMMYEDGASADNILIKEKIK